MSLKTSLLVAATALGLSTLSFAAQAATFRVPLTYTYSTGNSSSSSGTGYFDINDSLLQPDTSTIDLDDLLDFSLTFTGLAGTPSTTTFIKNDLIFWSFNTDENGTIIASDFFTSIAIPVRISGGGGIGISANTDGYDLIADILSGNGQNTTYIVTTGTPFPVPAQSTPEPGTVVALLGLGLGALASKVKKQD